MIARRRLTCLTALTLAAAPPAAAQTPAETAVLPRIIDTLCLDLVEALNGCETAVLLASETAPDTADLVILSDRRAAEPQTVLALVRGMAFDGPLFGQAPRLEAGPGNALRLVAEQIGIGRSPWSQALTIVHRGDGFLVAGLTYETYDRVVGGSLVCDVNLLTGDWATTAERVNMETGTVTFERAQTGRIAGARPPVTDWRADDPLPQPCEAALAEWYDAAPQ